MVHIQQPGLRRGELPALLGLAAVIAGAFLLVQGLVADLRTHDAVNQSVMTRVSPATAQVISQMQAAEDANPWHTVMIAGQALLIAGMTGLYLWERARSARLQRRVTALTNGRGGAPAVADRHAAAATSAVTEVAVARRHSASSLRTAGGNVV